MYWSVKLFGWPFTPHNANLSIQRIHNKHNLMLVKFPRVPVTPAPWYSVHQGNIGTHGTIGTLALLGACQPFHGAVVNLRHCRYFPHILRLAEWQWNSSIVSERKNFTLTWRWFSVVPLCLHIFSKSYDSVHVHLYFRTTYCIFNCLLCYRGISEQQPIALNCLLC